MDKLDLLLTKVKREKANAAQGGIDGAYINQFLKDAGSFVAAQKTTLDSADWAKSTDAAANKARGEALFDLTSRADMISKYLEANKGTLQKASYNDLKNALRQYTQAFASVRGISEGNKNFYSQFATQQDYDNYVAEEEEKAKTAEEKRKVLEQIDKTRKDYANWKTQADIVEGSGIYIGGNPLQHERVSTIVKEGGLLRPLYEQVSPKDIYEWNLFKMVDGAQKDPKFSEYVQQAADLDALFAREDAAFLKDAMEPEEYDLLKYYAAKDKAYGTNRLEDFIYYMKEIWNQRLGEKEAEWYKDKPILGALYGFKSGIDQFGSNLSNWELMLSTDPDKTYVPATSGQVASGIIKENLDGFGNFVFDIGSTVSNVVPSILTSGVLGLLNPALGAAAGSILMGAGAAGSAYAEKIQAGWSQSEATSYSFMVGASEAAISRVMGVVAKASGGGGLKGILAKFSPTALGKINAVLEKVAKTVGGKLALNALEEGAEEAIQAVLEPAFATVAKGEKFTADMADVLYSALLGAVTGAGFGAVDPNTYQGNNQKTAANDSTVPKAEMPEVTAPSVNATVPAGIATPTVTATPSQQTDALANVENLLQTAKPDPVADAVKAFKESGVVSNSKAEAILASPEALQKLTQQTGIPIEGTKSQQRAAVKVAVAKLNEQNAEGGSVPVAEQSAKDFVGGYSGITYDTTQAGLLSSVSVEGLQNAADLAGRQDITFNHIGINDQQTKQAWIDAGLAYVDTDADGNEIYVVNEAPLLDERDRRRKESAKKKTVPIEPPTPAEDNGWKVQKQEQLRKKLKNNEKQYRGMEKMLQQEADANGLVWENGVPFRKDLLELARKRQSGEFSIAPPVPESAKTETAKSQAAANIAPPTPAEDNGWKVQKQEQLRKKLKNNEKQYRGMEKMLSEEITALQAQLDQVKNKDSQKAAELREQIKEREESKRRWKSREEETSKKIKEEILRLEKEINSAGQSSTVQVTEKATKSQAAESIAPPTPAEQEIENVVKEADGDEDEVESRLLQKKKNLEWQLQEQEKQKKEYKRSKEEKIAAVREKLEKLADKDTKEARKLKNRIIRMEREKADALVEYDDKIRQIQNRITVTEERLKEDHTYQNRLENAHKRIEQIRQIEEDAATEQYNRERDALLEEVENKSRWISKKATSVKREMLNWEKDKSKASPILRELLASDHDWRELENALADVAAYPTKPYKTTTDAEDTVRAILSEAYADAYDKNMGKIEKLDESYDEQIKKINAEAAERKRKSTIAHKRKESNTKYLLEVAKIVGDTSTWVDKKQGISYKVNTLRRNLEDIVKDADGKPDLEKAHKIYDYLQGTYNKNEAQLKRELNELFDKYRNMKITKEENVYIQMLGEALQGSGDGQKTNVTKQEAADYYKANKDKIDDAKCREIIEMAREDYDKAFERVNEVQREHGMEELKYVQGYFPHLEEAPQRWWQKWLNFQPVKPQTELQKSRKAKADASKTSVAGRTGMFKPNKKSQSYAKERKGPTTDFNFLKGYEAYMTGALDWIYHIPDIQRRRALENYIRITHAENDLALTKKIKDIQKSDVYNADEEQVALEEVFKTMETPLSNFVTDLMIGTNALAGKKTSGDRSVEEFLSPETANTLKNLSGRVSANMVAGSISSALTNFIPITQSWGQVSPLYSLKAAKQMILGSAGGVKSGRIKDGIVEASTFLTNRLRNPDKLYKQFWDKVSTGAGALMETFDNVTSQIVWRSKFLQNLDEGMSEADAIKNADEFAEGLMAGRSRGNMPTLFESKNAIAKMATAFQLEVNNQYGYMFKDMPKEAKEKGLLRIAKGYMAMFAGAYVYNALYSMLTGRDSAFDPIGIIEDAIKGFQDDEEDVWADVWGVTQNVLQEIPFVGSLLGGGRVPLSSALPYEGNLKAMFEGFQDMSEGDWSDLTNEWLNPVYYLLAPMGGGQLKKSIGGAAMYLNDKEIKGSYTDSGNLRFPVENDFWSVVQAITMGQWSSGNARDYFEGGHKPLTEKQQEEFAESGMTIQEYWDYRDALGKLDKQAEKLDYINGMDVDEDTKYVLKWYLFDADKAAEEDPERFEWLENEIGYVEYRELDKDAQQKWSWAYNNQEEYDYMKKNGIRLEDVDVFTVTMTDFNSQKSAVAASLGGAAKYKEYMDEIGDVKGDKNANGDTISGSVKKNVWAYIDELDLEDGQKYILFKLKYPKDTKYDHKIVGYLRSRKDLTAQKRVDIYNELGIEP